MHCAASQKNNLTYQFFNLFHLSPQEKISLVFKAVQTEGLRDLQQSLERKKMVQAKDIQGRSPLHIAVLVGHKEAVEHIATNFPVAMKCKDNVSTKPHDYSRPPDKSV